MRRTRYSGFARLRRPVISSVEVVEKALLSAPIYVWFTEGFDPADL